MSWLTIWWVWIAGAVVFGILEVLAPVFVFMGFAAGAAVVGLCLAIGISFGGSVPLMIVVFAAISLIVSLALRKLLGTRQEEVKTFVNDIND